MFKHILLPTDGSKLSEASIRNGITLAKKIGAKVTGLCAVPSQNHFYLFCRESVRGGRGPLRNALRDQRSSPRSDYCCIRKARMRLDRDGLSREERPHGFSARQRNPESADSLPDARAGVALIRGKTSVVFVPLIAGSVFSAHQDPLRAGMRPLLWLSARAWR